MHWLFGVTYNHKLFETKKTSFVFLDAVSVVSDVEKEGKRIKYV